MSNTHALCRNNPLIPYRARPGRDPCVLKYPEDLASAKVILRSISKFDKMRQCSVCHLYVTGAPQAHLSHGAAPAGPGCTLPHHPSPCPWVDDRTGRPCQYVHAPPVPPLVSLTATTSASLLSPPVTISETQVGGADSIPDQTALLRRLEEGARKVQLLELANTNLRGS